MSARGDQDTATGAGARRPSVARVMVLTVLCGGVLGAVLGVVAGPDLIAALALGGAMTGGALGAGYFLLGKGGDT